VPTALITGVTGQDGRYLAERLVREGHEVVGIVRADDAMRAAVESALPDTRLLEADLRDADSIRRAVEASSPDQVYNLAAMSAPASSWEMAGEVCDVNAMGPLRLLDALRAVGALATVRVCHASSSEIFGRSETPVQDEQSPQRPRSPYGSSKAFAHNLVANYREAYGAFAVNAILFNHESPRRGPEFVTRKITRAVAAISMGQASEVRLGNLDVRRDWGHAEDYVDAMVRMLRHHEPADFVIATGRLHSLRDLLDAAFSHVGIADWSRFVVQDPALLRPVETDPLCGDPRKAHTVLGWRPQRSFGDLVAEMVEADLAALRQ
jgi:GDPmannose 4,6-dehydratase